MRVIKKAALLAIVLLAALFTSFTVTGNVAHAEEPPKISDHVYDPGNKLGSQADKVKDRLASLDRSGLHVYVAFPSEYSNDTVSNWNLMALQKSGAPQGSYMLSIVADNPNQTMYLASADNAAKLSQEELSAMATEKMVPLLNQQKYPEAVLAYLDALSTKAPEMGSGLAVAPWAMIAFLIALIVVIVVVSRALRMRRKAKAQAEDKINDEAVSSDSAASASAESVASAMSDENEPRDKGKFRLWFGRKEAAKAKSESLKGKVEKPAFPAVSSEALDNASIASPQAATAAASPVTSAIGPTPTAAAPSPVPVQITDTAEPVTDPTAPSAVAAASRTQMTGGKVPSLAELDQIALARSSSGASANITEGYQISGLAPQTQPSIPQQQSVPQQVSRVSTPLDPQGLTQTPKQTVSSAQPVPSRQATPGQQTASATPPQSSQLAIPGQVPAASPQPSATYVSPAAGRPSVPATAAPAPQAHSSVLRPGETTYLPPQANDDDTQVTSASLIKDYAGERRDEIARAKARAQAAVRFRVEQASKPEFNHPNTAGTSPVSVSPLPASTSSQQLSHLASPLPQPELAPSAAATTPTQVAAANAAHNNPRTDQASSMPQTATPNTYPPKVVSGANYDASRQGAASTVAAEGRSQIGLPSLPQMAPSLEVQAPYSLPPVSPQAIPQVSKQAPTSISRSAASPLASPQQVTVQDLPQSAPLPQKTQVPSATPSAPIPSPAVSSGSPNAQRERVSSTPILSSTPAQNTPVDRKPVQPHTPVAAPETSRPDRPQVQPDFTKVLRQADSWARKGASKLALAQQRVGKTVTQPFALALVRAQDTVRAAFAEFATAQLQSRPIDQQIVAGNLPAPLRELRDQITHFTNLYHQQTPLSEITSKFEREIVECREELVRCRLIVERIQNDDPQKSTRIGTDVMGAHKLLSRAQNLIEDAQTMERAGQENEVLKATVRTENLLLQARKIVRQAHAEEAAMRAGAKVTTALTFAEKVEPLSEQVTILMAAVDDYIGVHTAQVGIAARTMLDLANRTLTRLDRPGNLDTQEALRLLQRAKQQTEQALRLAENDVAKRS